MVFQIHRLDQQWVQRRCAALGGVGAATLTASPEKVKVGNISFYPAAQCFSTPRGLVREVKSKSQQDFIEWLTDWATYSKEAR